jgi:hypothetical protein
MGMPYFIPWAVIAQSAWLLATGWTFRGSSPSWRRDFPHPSRPALGPTQLPECWILTPSYGCKAGGAWGDHPPPSRTEVKEGEDLYLYSSFGLSRSVQGWPLPLPHVTLFYFFFCYAELFRDLLQTMHWEIQIFMDIIHGYRPWPCVTYTVEIASLDY